MKPGTAQKQIAWTSSLRQPPGHNRAFSCPRPLPDAELPAARGATGEYVKPSMLHDGKNWCVVTTYKENYSLLSAFVPYYRRHYGIEKFLLLCGLSGSRTHASLKDLISRRLKAAAAPADQAQTTRRKRALTVSEFAGNGFVLWAASYAAADFTSEVDFHDLKVELHQWADDFLPAEVTRTLTPDNDEFLHVKNPCILEGLDRLGFHFVDLIPSPVWPPDTLRFSLQGWYYRRQAQPRFNHGGRLALAVSKMLGRGLDHGGCKTFFFDRARLKNYTVWHHGTDDSLCSCLAVNAHLDQPERCGEILRDTACGYHLAMTCKEHFLSERLRLFSRLQTDLKKRPVHDAQQSPETTDRQLAGRTFDRFIKQSRFPTFTDVLLLPYLQAE
jgi:hypothetical protein